MSAKKDNKLELKDVYVPCDNGHVTPSALPKQPPTCQQRIPNLCDKHVTRPSRVPTVPRPGCCAELRRKWYPGTAWASWGLSGDW